MPGLADLAVPKTGYLLEKALQKDLSQFIGQKNTPETQLRVAQTIKYYHHKAKSMGFDGGNDMATIYSPNTGINTATGSVIFNDDYATSGGANIIYDGTAASATNIYSSSGAGTGTMTNCTSTSSSAWASTNTSSAINNWYDENEMSHHYNVNGINVTFRSDAIGQVEVNGLLAKKTKLMHNLAVHVKSRANVISKVKENEQVAIETLRETITEREFRKYIKYGFVLVKGKSGDTYQVFRNRSHTKVWRNGKVIEEVCVRIRSDQKVPPTDNVIAFKTMIETDEQEFKKIANVYNMKVA